MGTGVRQLQLVGHMTFEINKKRVTLIIVGVFAIDLWLSSLGGRASLQRAVMTVPPIALALGPLLILFGVWGQLWARRRPKLRSLGLLAYGLTLIWSLSFGLILLLFLRERFW